MAVAIVPRVAGYAVRAVDYASTALVRYQSLEPDINRWFKYNFGIDDWKLWLYKRARSGWRQFRRFGYAALPAIIDAYIKPFNPGKGVTPWPLTPWGKWNPKYGRYVRHNRPPVGDAKISWNKMKQNYDIPIKRIRVKKNMSSYEPVRPFTDLVIYNRNKGITGGGFLSNRTRYRRSSSGSYRRPYNNRGFKRSNMAYRYVVYY